MKKLHEEDEISQNLMGMVTHSTLRKKAKKAKVTNKLKMLQIETPSVLPPQWLARQRSAGLL